MDKMLQFHPGKRIDVAAALKHPWLAQLHDETQEPAAPGMWLQSCRVALTLFCAWAMLLLQLPYLRRFNHNMRPVASECSS
jgi:serine/threonine protein kinase